jgi:hypothetical protein
MLHEASPAGTLRPRVLNTIRATLQIIWIEFRRCGGYLMLPLILPLVWFFNQGFDDYGVVLWFRMSIVTFQSYIIIGPCTAGLVAFLIGRDRRRRTEGLIETVPIGPFRRDLLLLGAGAAWGLVAYAIVGAWYLGQAALFATWGGPDLGWLMLGVLATLVHAAFGLLVGRVIRGRFAALVALALPIAFAIGVETYRSVNGQQPLRPLSPFLQSQWFGVEAVAGPPVALIENLLWLDGLLGSALATIALVRHGKSTIGLAGLGVSLLVGAIGASAVLAQNPEGGYVESLTPPFEWSCLTEAGIEVCMHPAYEARLDDAAAGMARVVTPVAGLPGVPTRWEDQMGHWTHNEVNDEVGSVYAYSEQTMVWSLADEIFHGEPGERPASQLVFLAVLAERAGVDGTELQFLDWPTEAMTVTRDGFRMPDESKMEELQPKMEASVARFMALSPEEQRAWLEANWDALRAGELTLDDMP